jgi:serine/threonine protein kinase
MAANPYQLMFQIAGAKKPPPIPKHRMSEELYDLVLSCFHMDYKHRPTAVQLLSHPFFSGGSATPSSTLSESVFDNNSAHASIGSSENNSLPSSDSIAEHATIDKVGQYEESFSALSAEFSDDEDDSINTSINQHATVDRVAKYEESFSAISAHFSDSDDDGQ